MAKKTKLESDTSLFDYIVQHMDERFDSHEQRFDKIDQKLESLLNFKLKLAGAGAVIGALVALAIDILFK